MAETWERLFDLALACLDSIPDLVPPPHWTFGGGTALRLQIGHRESHDIDIFLEGPQWLSVLSPRLNDTVDALCRHYEEDTQYIKLVVTEGEVDFIAAPLLTSPGALPRQIAGRQVLVETPAEIVAKKLYFRGGLLRPRDVLDVAAVWRFDRAALLASKDAWATRIDNVARRLSVLRANPEPFHERLAELRLLAPGEMLRSSALDTFAEFLTTVQRQTQVDKTSSRASAGRSRTRTTQRDGDFER